MSWISVDLKEGDAFRPGQVLEGSASWQLDAPPRAVEIRLFWFTSGKGTQDVAVVDALRFETPSQNERQEFRFPLPESPYSFSGPLITLTWAVEAVAEPSGEAGRREFTLSPAGREVALGPEG